MSSNLRSRIYFIGKLICEGETLCLSFEKHMRSLNFIYIIYLFYNFLYVLEINLVTG